MPKQTPEERRAQRHAFYQANRDRILAAVKAYTAKNREKKRAHNRAYQAANREIIRLQRQVYRRNNRERLREKHQKYYLAHREALLVYLREYQQKNRAALAEKQRQYAVKTRENMLERKRLYREKTREHRKAKQASWAEANKERLCAYFREYRRTHQAQGYAARAARRARLAGASRNDLTRAQWQEILAVFQHCCAYCGRQMQRLTQDHITPLRFQGQHTLHNIVPSCRSCNSKKALNGPLQPVQPLLLTLAEAQPTVRRS